MSPAETRSPAWVDDVVARLRDTQTCPICGAELGPGICVQCGADYREVGQELWDASKAAVKALEARQAVLARVGRRRSPQPADSEPAVAPAVSQRTPTPAVIADADPDAAQPPRSSATVQSVLAVAGAGLVAVAAIVFTFFNPDLTDPVLRGWIVGGVTAVFLAGAAILARRGLRFSAEAVGALGLVFVGLDVYALAVAAPSQPWAVAAVATAIAATGAGWLSFVFRVRVWLSASTVAVAFVPGMIGYHLGAPVLAHLAVAVAAFALLAALAPLGRRWGKPLTGERVALTVTELTALVVALVHGTVLGRFPSDVFAPSLSATLVTAGVLAVVSTRYTAPALWSSLAGVFGTAATLVVPWALAPEADLGAVAIGVTPVAAIIGAIVWVLILPTPSAFQRTPAWAAALTVVTIAVLPATITALALSVATVVGTAEATEPWGAASVVAGLAATGAGFVLFVAVARGLRRPLPGLGWIGVLGLWLGLLSAVTLVCLPAIDPWVRVAIGLTLGSGLALGQAMTPLRRASAAIRHSLVTGAHVLVVVAAIVSWHAAAELATIAGTAVVLSVAALARTLPRRARFVHVGVAFAYSLLVIATALSLAGVDSVAMLCLITSIAAIGAIAATFAPVVEARSWYAILVVTSVPFLVGVAQVVVDRSGWTALSTALIFALALTLVTTRREGTATPLRLTAATILVPSLAVVAVCLGAQLLPGSGSPVVLPIIALIVSAVLPCGPLLRDGLTPRIGPRDAGLVRLAIEASTLLTAAIAVALALVREAAGLSTTLIVLVILGVGGVATAVRGGRRYGWWLAGTAFTGALWCAWGIAGVEVIEPYLLPPATVAATVGAILTVRGRPALRLFAAGLLAAILPLLVILAIDGAQPRAVGILVASFGLLVLGAVFARRGHESLAIIAFAVGVLAASAGAVQGIRLGSGADAASLDVPVIFLSLSFGLVAGVAAAAAVGQLRRLSPPGSRLSTSRWLYAPAFVYATAAAWPSIDRDWLAIWTMWTLMLALLLALVVIARRGLHGPTALPPVWFVFGLAFTAAVVAWSPRELRVEWFSLPLGTALLVAGALAMRSAQAGAGAGDGKARSLRDWPAGWSGSWNLLAPGIIVLLSASVTATFTDPLTWRAILVIVLALAAILLGAGRRLAAPFLIGIIVLPIENAIAFAVQIGRGIQSMPWWITLAVVGAVLLIIAVTYERRAGEHSGIAARLRDLA